MSKKSKIQEEVKEETAAKVEVKTEVKEEIKEEVKEEVTVEKYEMLGNCKCNGEKYEKGKSYVLAPDIVKLLKEAGVIK